MLAANAPIYDAVESAVTNHLTHAALAQVGATHVAGDKLARALGIPTTEDGLTAHLGASCPALLDLSNPAAVLELLSQKVVR